MIRVIIEYVTLFLLPTIIYVAYMFLSRPNTGGNAKAIDDAPLIWLFIAGAVLTFGTLIYVGATTTGGRPNQGYEPAVIRDNHIEPGHLK